MPSTPDKLFRDHLEHFKKSPPPQAWSRIESGLNTNTHNRLWLSIAATVLILLAASFLLWHAGESAKKVAATETLINGNTLTDQNTVAAAVPLSNQQPSSPIVKTEKAHLALPGKSKATKKENAPVQHAIADQQEIITTLPEEQSIAEAIRIPETNSTSREEPVVTMATQSSTLHSNKITYSSGEVNSRFLKKDSTASVPAMEKPSNGMQKIKDIAADLKDEAALGELRQMKNEILSFPIKEFTKDKQ